MHLKMLFQNNWFCCDLWLWTNQCCASGMFYPRSGSDHFFLSRIADPDLIIFSFRIRDLTWKVESKLFSCFLCFQERILILSHSQKEPGSGIQEPGSGKNSSRIPDSGGKKAPNPGSASATLVQTLYLIFVKKRWKTYFAHLS
jgi:hypothetical protein